MDGRLVCSLVFSEKCSAGSLLLFSVPCSCSNEASSTFMRGSTRLGVNMGVYGDPWSSRSRLKYVVAGEGGACSMAIGVCSNVTGSHESPSSNSHSGGDPGSCVGGITIRRA